jgi:hypothetical protein
MAIICKLNKLSSDPSLSNNARVFCLRRLFGAALILLGYDPQLLQSLDILTQADSQNISKLSGLSCNFFLLSLMIPSKTSANRISATPASVVLNPALPRIMLGYMSLNIGEVSRLVVAFLSTCLSSSLLSKDTNEWIVMNGNDLSNM